MHNVYHIMDQLPVCTHLTRTGGFQPSRSVQAHAYAATDLDLHPRKPVVATASDDHSWKLWTITRYYKFLYIKMHFVFLTAVSC